MDGLSAWQLYHDERYLASAEVPHDCWVRYEVEFIDHQLRIFVDGEKEPVLTSQLKQDADPGAIGIWGNGAGFFSNFQYENLDQQQATVARTKQSIEPGVVTNWQISQRYSAENHDGASIPADIQYQTATVEDQGFINVSRYLPRGADKALVFGKTTLHADEDQRIKLWFGYSDEVTILLNGRAVFEGNSRFNFRAPFALGLLDDDHDAIYLDLKAGEMNWFSPSKKPLEAGVLWPKSSR